jgi:hypothetical protein
MNRDDPLWLCLLRSERNLDLGPVADHRDRLRVALDRLEAYLNDLLKRPNLMDVTPRVQDALGGFDSNNMPRAQALYRRVVETGGAGTIYVQEGFQARLPVW